MQEHFIRQLHRAIDSLYLNMVGWTLYFKLVTLVTSCQVHHRVCVTMFYSFSFLIFRCQRTLSSDHNYLTTSMHKTVNLFVLRNLFLFCVVGRAYGVGEIPKTKMGIPEETKNRKETTESSSYGNGNGYWECKRETNDWDVNIFTSSSEINHGS